MKCVWAIPTDICGCNASGVLILELGEASLTTDFMELDESIDPAPPEQTEVAVTRDEGIVMEDEEVETQDTSAPASVPSPDYSPPDDQPPTPNQMTIGPDRGLLVQGSQSLVRVKLPDCFMASRIFFLEHPEFNQEWMTESISEPESIMELAAIWLKLRLRENQTVDPGLTAPVWYPAQLLGYSNQTLQDRFDSRL